LVLGKRRRVDDLDSALRSTLATTAPSVVAKKDHYKSIQQRPSSKILDDRPQPDHVPPASLLYDGFGHFNDIFSRRGDKRDKKRQDLETAVDAFADKMTQIYPDELGRRTVALSILNQILFPDSHRTIMAASIGSTHTDGHYDGPHGAASCIFEFKDELVDISAIPEVELSAYAARSHKQSIESSQKAKEVFLGWRVPCLGITVVGKLTLHFQMNLA
jgi:hypothetical protein